jgi:acyl carrier protein
MGIELTEFIMRVEDEFLIAIPDEVADAIRTVGDLHRAVVKSLHTPLQIRG